MKPSFFPLSLTLAASIAAGPSALLGGNYEITSEESTLEVHVPKAGMFSFVGHEHTIVSNAVRGRVTCDAEGKPTALEIEVAVNALDVTDEPLSPEDRAKVRANMLSAKVLNQESHPVIRYEGDRIELIAADRWHIHGELTVAGQRHPISFEATIELDGEALSASGAVELKLSDFGIKPVSALGGTVRTGKHVEVRFQVSAIFHP